MRELYTVRAYLTNTLIEVSSFDNAHTGGCPRLTEYFQAFGRLHPNVGRIPDDVRLKIDGGVDPWFRAAIYDAVTLMPRYKSCHRMLLLAQLTPQIIDASRFCRMMYGSSNEAGMWEYIGGDELVVLRANDLLGDPVPFANRLSPDVPRLPQLLHDYLHRA